MVEGRTSRINFSSKPDKQFIIKNNNLIHRPSSQYKNNEEAKVQDYFRKSLDLLKKHEGSCKKTSMMQEIDGILIQVSIKQMDKSLDQYIRLKKAQKTKIEKENNIQSEAKRGEKDGELAFEEFLPVLTAIIKSLLTLDKKGKQINSKILPENIVFDFNNKACIKNLEAYEEEITKEPIPNNPLLKNNLFLKKRVNVFYLGLIILYSLDNEEFIRVNREKSIDSFGSENYLKDYLTSFQRRKNVPTDIFETLKKMLVFDDEKRPDIDAIHEFINKNYSVNPIIIEKPEQIKNDSLVDETGGVQNEEKKKDLKPAQLQNNPAANLKKTEGLTTTGSSFRRRITIQEDKKQIVDEKIEKVGPTDTLPFNENEQKRKLLFRTRKNFRDFLSDHLMQIVDIKNPAILETFLSWEINKWLEEPLEENPKLIGPDSCQPKQLERDALKLDNQYIEHFQLLVNRFKDICGWDQSRNSLEDPSLAKEIGLNCIKYLYRVCKACELLKLDKELESLKKLGSQLIKQKNPHILKEALVKNYYIPQAVKKINQLVLTEKAIFIKSENQNQVEIFKKWRDKAEWFRFHISHYDWWTFPIDELSSHQDKYTVNPIDINCLKYDELFMGNLKYCLESVALSWGWDIKKEGMLSKKDKSQEWQKWGVRLYKAAKSAMLFDLDNEFKSLIKYGMLLLNNKYTLTYAGRDFSNFFRENAWAFGLN